MNLFKSVWHLPTKFKDFESFVKQLTLLLIC